MESNTNPTLKMLVLSATVQFGKLSSRVYFDASTVSYGKTGLDSQMVVSVWTADTSTDVMFFQLVCVI